MRSEAPLVVLLPHPDDEFAVLPFLAAAAAEGRGITLIWLTDGGAGHASPEQRRKESLRVLAESGLDGVDCRFLGIDEGIPDGGLHHHLERAKHAAEEVLAGLHGPVELWLPAWEGGHPDHDATHALGRAIARATGASARQYPLYRSADRWGWTFTVLSPLPSMAIARAMHLNFPEAIGLLRRCGAYRSQWRSFAGLLPVIAVRLLLLRRPLVLGQVDLAASLERPHEGVLLYERRTACTWADLRAAIAGIVTA